MPPCAAATASNAAPQTARPGEMLDAETVVRVARRPGFHVVVHVLRHSTDEVRLRAIDGAWVEPLGMSRVRLPHREQPVDIRVEQKDERVAEGDVRSGLLDRSERRLAPRLETGHPRLRGGSMFHAHARIPQLSRPRVSYPARDAPPAAGCAPRFQEPLLYPLSYGASGLR